MAYHTTAYLIVFLPVTACIYQLARRDKRRYVLLLAGYYFFWTFSKMLLFFLIGTTLFTHYICLWMTRIREQKLSFAMRECEKPHRKTGNSKEEKKLLLEVSGAEDPVLCTVRKTGDGFEGTVEMPGIPEIGTETFCGISFTAVRMEGITHLICEDRTFEREAAESLLRRIAGLLPDEAIGLIQWDRTRQYMRPLVFVRGSGSLVWEHGCGSGSAAVGAAEALRNGTGETEIEVKQPGGTIRVSAAAENGKILSVKISGRVKLGIETIIEIP